MNGNIERVQNLECADIVLLSGRLPVELQVSIVSRFKADKQPIQTQGLEVTEESDGLPSDRFGLAHHEETKVEHPFFDAFTEQFEPPAGDRIAVFEGVVRE